MIRLDTAGRDVTDSPGLWSEEDAEIVQTNYPHPDITSGQHTNGPAAIWIRKAETGEWCCTHQTHMHKVRKLWEAHGGEWVESLEGQQLNEDELFRWGL